MDEAEAIRQFLGERPDAQQLRDWRETLEQRLEALEREVRRAAPPSPALLSRVEQLRRQVAVLREEEAITGFVEDSVRVTLAMGSLEAALDGLDE